MTPPAPMGAPPLQPRAPGLQYYVLHCDPKNQQYICHKLWHTLPDFFYNFCTGNVFVTKYSFSMKFTENIILLSNWLCNRHDGSAVLWLRNCQNLCIKLQRFLGVLYKFPTVCMRFCHLAAKFQRVDGSVV